MQSLTRTLSIAVLLSRALITTAVDAQQAGGRNGADSASEAASRSAADAVSGRGSALPLAEPEVSTPGSESA